MEAKLVSLGDGRDQRAVEGKITVTQRGPKARCPKDAKINCAWSRRRCCRGRTDIAKKTKKVIDPSLADVESEASCTKRVGSGEGMSKVEERLVKNGCHIHLSMVPSWV